MTDARTVAAAVDQAHREHWASVLAATVRVTRDLDAAEDCAQDAYLRALRHWTSELPANPGGWLSVVARRIALDRVRRQSSLARRLPALAMESTRSADGTETTVDDPLRLLFMCCHPSLSRDAQLALTLRLMCGLTTGEIGRVLLTQETAIAARITRAKRKIATAGVPFRLPDPAQRATRLSTVLTVVHLTYTAGHTDASGTGELARTDLTHRAVAIARRLVLAFADEPEAHGLLALLLFHEARGATRQSDTGDLVLLAEQDRRRWDTGLTHEGLAHATEALRRGDGPFTYQAGIAGLHASAPSSAETDWPQVVSMYDRLYERWPTPIVALNRLAARSLVDGADLHAVLVEVDQLAADATLDGYPYLPATRADLLRRLGRREEAAAAYDEALGRSANDVERRFLAARRRQVT